ncbi:MAG: DUF2695 domain-containing protein [Acidobacteria bacterium]|nr:DUF2695 domain-containing protein [Acidobacteriota bacterium]
MNNSDPINSRCVDDELIASILPDVMTALRSRNFFKELDNRLCPLKSSTKTESCGRDFAISESILQSYGYDDAAFADVFGVMRAQGGFCDCEILYNVCETSRLKTAYWTSRTGEMIAKKPHH